MKTITIFAINLFLTLFCFAQEGGKVAQTIKGKVVNDDSNRPVSYTNIGLEGTFYGTASDADGNFELKVPGELANKNIYFSAVGFKNKQFPVKQLFSKEFNVIKLQSQSYGVGEVDIAAQNMVLIRILRMASENIKYNYGAGPFNLHCNYSCEKTVNDKVQQPTIANVLVYDEAGYANVSTLNAFQKRHYKVNKKNEEDNSRFATAINNLDDLLALDWVRSASSVLNSGLLSGFVLKLDDQPAINGKEYWVIAFSQKHPTLEGSGDYYASSFSGKITINKEDYSVLKIEAEVSADKNSRQGRGLAVSASNKTYLLDVSYSFTVEYKDLLVKQVVLNKMYKYEGKEVSEKSIMEVTRAHTNNLTEVVGRDYFAGE